MSLVEAAFYVIGFFAIWGSVMFAAFVVDKFLHRVFGKGMFPEGFWR